MNSLMMKYILMLTRAIAMTKPEHTEYKAAAARLLKR